MHFSMPVKDFLLSLIVEYFLFHYYVQCSEDNQFLEGTISIQNVTFGKQFINSLISEITDVHVEHCAEECMRRPRCLSINYKRRFLLCELNFNDTSESERNLIVNSSAIYIERSFLKMDLLSACSGMVCNSNEQCEEDMIGDPNCVLSDCGFPPDVPNADSNMSHGIGVYATMAYRCRENTCLETNGKSYIGCQSTGHWSPIRFTCRDVCPSGWLRFESSCYHLNTAELTWNEAKTTCEDQNAYFTEITSASEDSFVENYLNGAIWAWIGGTDEGNEGNWRWSNSNSLIGIGTTGQTAYTNWGLTEPNGNENENCMVYLGSSAIWVDIYCLHVFNFICERSNAILKQGTVL